MTVERQRQIEDLCRAALERPAEERAAFLASRVAGDADLRLRVEGLLAEHDARPDTLERRAASTPSRPGPLPAGTLLANFRIEHVIAEGGMGVVYAATDTVLNRPVAVKLLSEHLFDATARLRFEREAQLASALNHPHILTVHAAGEHAGRQYIVTEYVDGGTLNEWISRRSVRGWRQRVELLIGVADALATAHDANILHRDIKPGNILVTKSGYAKLADFGLAKLAEELANRQRDMQTTRTGVVLGTVAYMSPEQAAGQPLDARSDIFSFGVVLYEVLAGRRPFHGTSDLELRQNVVGAEPEQLPDSVPAAVRQIVEKAIEKDPAERYQTMRDFVVDLRRAVRRTGEHPSSQVRVARTADERSALRKPAQKRRVGAVAAGAVVALGALAVGGWLLERSREVQRARAETIPEIARLVDQDDYPTAFALARELPPGARDDPLLSSLRPLFTAKYSISTVPPDADVLVRAYRAVDGDWQSLGRTPLVDVEVPRQALRWRIEKTGYETVELATSAQADNLGGRNLERALSEIGSVPADMVPVPGGPYAGTFPVPPAELVPFLIDRYEVTNRAYKEFVDAGGYERRGFWEGLDIVDDGRPLSFEEAMELFVDSTGRPGPATWELGSYPEGRADYPVTGVSWYEAAAYARFRGKALPTVYHWDHAARSGFEVASSLAAASVPLSNLASQGPAAVGVHEGVGPYGTYDMFGNVREWCANLGHRGGWVIGGSWSDPQYSYFVAAAVTLLERSPLNGVRLMQDADDPVHAATLREPFDIAPRSRGLETIEPVSDEIYGAYLREFAYRSGPLNASAPVTMSATDDWVKQRVSIDAGYNGERMDIVLFVPQHATPPLQPVIFVSGIQIVLSADTLDNVDVGFGAMPLDYIVKSGRVLVQPILQGTYNRWKAPYAPADGVRTAREWIERRWDIGRTIDYLEARPDIDASRLGYVGVSFGASSALPLVAVEPRFKAVVLLAGGLPPPGTTPLVEPLNYASRITSPVLMVNGRYDEIFPVDTNQLPLFELLGAPLADKRHVILESGHGSPPRADVLREVLGWLDKYLGPVD
jgi:tRNA A-37 threonylcarbamoyl transferase component Bud32/predicted esterase